MAQEWCEVLAQRRRTSKTKRLYEDDQPTNKYSWDGMVGTSLHYEEVEDSGEWLEVDPRIVPSDEPGWDWEMRKSHWRFLVRNGGWFAAEKKGVGIGFRLERIAYLNIESKEYQTIRTASYGTPTVSDIEHGNDLLANPLGKLTWADLFPDVDFEIYVSGDGLHEEIKVSQAARDAMPAPPYPATDTYLVLVYEVDWGQVPGLADDEGDIDYDADFERTARLYLKNHQGEIISALPASRAWPEGRPVDENSEPIQVALRKRFIKVGGRHYLLVGAPVLVLNALPEGTLIFDPDVDVQVDADSDDCYTYGTTMKLNEDYIYIDWSFLDNHAYFRFLNIGIAPGATIDHAYIDLCSYTTVPSVDSDVRIMGIAEADTATFSTQSDADGRPVTGDFVDWTITTWTGNAWYGRTNDPQEIKAIIDEIVNEVGGWGSGSDLAIKIINTTQTKEVRAWSHDGDDAKAAKLHIEFTVGNGETFYQSAAGALTYVGTLQKKAEVPGVGVLTFVGASSRTMKFARSMLSGVLTSSGAVKGKAKKILSGALTSSGILIGKAEKVLSAALTLGGTLTRKGMKALAGTSTYAGTVAKKVGTTEAGTLSFIGAITKKTSTARAGVLTLSGAVKAKAEKALVGAATFVGAVQAKAEKSLAGALTLSGTAKAKARKALTGAWTGTGALAGKAKKAVAGTLALAGALSRKVAISVSGAWSGSGVVSGTRLRLKALAGIFSASGVLARKTAKSFAGSLSLSGSLRRLTRKVLAGALGLAGRLGLVPPPVGMVNLTLPKRSLTLTLPERSLDLTLPERDLTLTVEEL